MNYLNKRDPTSITEYLTKYMEYNPYLEEIIEDVKYLPKIVYTDIITPTPYRISTMTCIFNLNELIDIKHIYDNLDSKFNIKNDKVFEISGCIFGSSPIKGYVPKSRKPTKCKINFYNQLTLSIKLYENKYVKAKLFINGKVQMTGVPDFKTREICIYTIYNLVQSLSPEKKYSCSDIKTVLINSDFDMGCNVNREALHDILLINYNIAVSYESETYPGVKIKFFWNIEHDEQDGVCRCPQQCSKKIKKEKRCKKVTIAVFQSGKIIITGGQTIQQVHSAYQFICRVFKEQGQYIALPRKEKPKYVLIPKSKIINYSTVFGEI